MKKSTTKVTIIFIVLIMAVVGYYAYLSNQKQQSKAEESMTAVQEVLSRNLDLNYPSTPKEVIKLYNEITKCFYNEECSEEEIKDLATMVQKLYDRDLVAINPYDSYVENLKAEIAQHKEKNEKLTNCAVAASTSVDYYTVDGFNFARLQCGYTIVENGKSKSTSLVYLLRRDSETKNWKIYGWDLTENLRIGQDE